MSTRSILAAAIATGWAGAALFSVATADAAPAPEYWGYGGYGMMCDHPVNSGGAMVFGAGGYFCDEAPVASGQHFHCEWGGFIGYGGSCNWRWADNSIAWKDWTCTTQQIIELRTTAATSFGSCSFTEPIDDLKAMGLL